MEIIWRAKARQQLSDVLDYFIEVSGERAALNLWNKVESTVSKLPAHPHLGSVERYLEGLAFTYRSIVVHKNYKLLYRVENDCIHILSVFDCRQHPNRMNKEIAED